MNQPRNFSEASSRVATRVLKQLRDEYKTFLDTKNAQGSPQVAHQFTLAARHRGVTYNRTVSELIVAFEGKLPSYWQAD